MIKRKESHMRRQNGIGLVSVLILIMGIGIIVAVASPIAITLMQEARMRATLSEMRLLSEAIALYHPDEAGGFGFIGDVGRFPYSLRELVENYRGLPPWDVATGIGWQGPYIEKGFAAVDLYSLDGWGNPYIYTFLSTTGIITSRGSDDADGGDGFAADFSTENLTPRRYGIIRGQVRDILGAPLPGVAVSVEEPVVGAATWRIPIITDGGGFYSFSGVIVGRRRVRATFGGFTHYLHTIVTPHLEARADFGVVVDVTIPQAPTGLTATPEVFGGIMLDWLPPTSNTDGTALTDLAGFNIYRYRQLNFPFAGFTPTSENRIATLGPVHFFHDRTVSSHYIYHYIVRAFDKAGNESDPPFTIVSAITANGVDNIRNVARVTRWGTRNITVGIRNFSASPITVDEVRVSWGQLPDDALHGNFRVRFGQTGADWRDHWHIDDVEVIADWVTVFSDDFEDGTLSPWTADVAGNAGVDQRTASVHNVGWSMWTGYGAVNVDSPIINLAGATSATLNFWIRRGHDNFSEDPDGYEDLLIQYLNNLGEWITLGTFIGIGPPGDIYVDIGPETYSGARRIRTRIPTSASWTIVSRDETANGEAVFLDWPGFTLNAYGTTNYEGIFRVGFNTTMPVGTLITIVLNPGPGESRFDVIW